MGARERWSDQGGFTLVELFIVTIIIGILAAIAIAVFLGQREKAQRSSAISSLRNTMTYAVAITQETSDFSDDPDRYELEGGRGIAFTNGPAEGPNVVSIATFEDGEVLVLAARGGDSCYWLRGTAGEQDQRGTTPASDPTDCDADDLQGAAANGW